MREREGGLKTRQVRVPLSADIIVKRVDWTDFLYQITVGNTGLVVNAIYCEGQVIGEQHFMPEGSCELENFTLGERLRNAILYPYAFWEFFKFWESGFESYAGLAQFDRIEGFTNVLMNKERMRLFESAYHFLKVKDQDPWATTEWTYKYTLDLKKIAGSRVIRQRLQRYHGICQNRVPGFSKLFGSQMYGISGARRGR